MPRRRRRSCGAGTPVEEMEHKGVAYDTWLHATRDWTSWKRWKVKSLVMLYVTRNFVVDRTEGTLELLRQDGVTGPRAWARLIWYVLVKPGMLRKIAGAWLHYFMPGFHPWNHDDRGLSRTTRQPRPRRPHPLPPGRSASAA